MGAPWAMTFSAPSSFFNRYHNRVHTGYDWNMYNKTHYDLQNPPPKTVQGYKFNIM